MKYQFKIFLFFSILLSCKKEGENPLNLPPDPEKPSIPFREIKTADATLQATYISSIYDSGFIGNITYIQGIAFAQFKSKTGQAAVPKSVKAEAQALELENGIFQSTPVISQGLDFGSITEWEVIGQGDIPDFTENWNAKVPEIGDVNLKDTIEVSEDLWLGIDFDNGFTSLGAVDSIGYLIVGNSGELRQASASTDSLLFPSEDLKALGKGRAWIQVEAFRMEPRDFSGYKVLLVNKGVLTKAVWVD